MTKTHAKQGQTGAPARPPPQEKIWAGVGTGAGTSAGTETGIVLVRVGVGPDTHWDALDACVMRASCVGGRSWRFFCRMCRYCWEVRVQSFEVWREARRRQGNAVLLGSAERWIDLVPYEVAIAQAAWERKQRVGRMREAGLTFAQMGYYLNDISRSRVHQLWRMWQRDSGCSPVERWQQSSGDVAELAGRLRFKIAVIKGRRTRVCRSHAERRYWLG